MEDDNFIEEQPSTSRKESVKEGHSSDDDKIEDDGGDSKMDSVSSRSSSVSVRSRVEIANTRHKIVKPPSAVKESKLPEKKKKRKIPTGRIEKRLMPRRLTKKPMKRRLTKPRIAKRKPTQSTSTIFSRQSSGTVSPKNFGCQYCGHRCCRRRYKVLRRDREEEKRRGEHRRVKPCSKKKGIQNISKKFHENILRSECIQAGSRSLMLSSLCENTKTLQPEDPKETPQFCDVTPQMIYQSLRRLTMWQQDVTTMTILEYVKRNYPVCQDIPALFEELALKLQVAVIVGFVALRPMGRWRLCCALQERQLSSNHVTLFWLAYADTMKPVTQKVILPTPTKEKDEKQTNAKSEEGIIKHDYDII